MKTTLLTCVVFLHVITCHQILGDDRYRRQTDSQMTIQLTPEQKERIVDVHNTLRRREPATDMTLMEWHDGLAAESQNLTSKCLWMQRPPQQLKGVVQGFDQLTEIVHFSQSLVDIDEVTKVWGEEAFHYEYDTLQCNKVCWHYTQVVWASSHSVGCSIGYCPLLGNAMSPWGENGGYLISCIYGPGGNVDGQHPYTHGDSACSDCSSSFPYCFDGLCSRREPPPKTTVTEPTTVTTQKPRTTTKVTIGSASRPCTLIGGYAGLLFILTHLLF